MKPYRLIATLLLLALILSFAGVPNAAAVDAPGQIVPAQISPQCVGITPSSCPSFSVTKTADAPNVMAGDLVGYKITVANTGGVALSGLTVSDPLPAGLTWTADNANCNIDANNALYCALGSLPVGQSVTVHVTATSPATMCATISNTANAWSDGHSSVASNTADIVLNCAPLVPDITVVKTAENPTVAAGAPVRFTLTVSNQGTGPAQGVLLTDILPSLPGFSWTIGTVTGGGSCVMAGGKVTCDFGTVEAAGIRTVTVSSPTTADSCGVVSNTATVSATNEAADKTTNNTSTASTTVDCPPPSVKVTKTVDADAVNLNQALGFSLVVENTGTTAVKNLRLTDALASGLAWTEDSPSCSINSSNTLTCAFGDLAAGGKVSVHVAAAAGTSTCGDLSNTASVVGDNLTQQASNTAIIHVNCAPDVSVTKVATPKEIQYALNGAAQTPVPATFKITVDNHGTGPAQNVTVTDALPVLLYNGQPANTGLVWTITQQPSTGSCAINNAVLSCTFASLSVGQSESVVISSPTDQIPAPASQTAEITNSVSVTSSNEPVENRTDNLATATIKITWAAPLCVSDPPFNGRYINHFAASDPNAATGWSLYQIDHTRDGSNTPFMGRMSNNVTTLTLGCLPVNTYLRLSFDLYILGSMDGNAVYLDSGKKGPGPDVMKFLISDPRATDPVQEGQMLLQTSFTNWPFFRQSYPGSYPDNNYPSKTGAVASNSLGFDYMGILMDSTYHINLTFYNTRETQLFVFAGTNLQPLFDESWGLNNVVIDPVTPIYLPVVGH